MRNYIGLDAHSATSTFVVVNKEGIELDRRQVMTTEKNLLSYVRSIKGEKSLTFEETNLSQWLWFLFKEEVDDLIVCNPCYVSKKQGPKNDYRDARHLAGELRCNNLTAVFHEDNEFMDMRALIGAYSDLTGEIVRSKNRYKALFRSAGLNTKGQTMYKMPQRVQELSRPMHQFVADDFINRILFLEDRKKLFLKEFESIKTKHKAIRNLSTIPGISKIRGAYITALICSPHRFQNKHKFWAYSMLVKYNQESDGKSYGKVNVRGRKELKNIFLGAAEGVLRGTSSLKKYHDDLLLKGLERRAAKVSLARKIAAISLSLLKNNTVYRDKHEEVRKRANKKN